MIRGRINMYLSEVGARDYEQWIRGILFKLEYDNGQIEVYANGHFMDEMPCEQESYFKSAVNHYLCLVRTGHGIYTVPKFASNEEDYFVYEVASSEGELTYLEDYTHVGWGIEKLSDEELASGVFYLPKTSEILPSLIKNKWYTIIHGYFEEETYVKKVLVHQTLETVESYLQSERAIKSYLTGHLQIFDESRARRLPIQDMKAYISLECSDGVNEISLLPRLSQIEVKESGQLYSLTELSQYYRLDVVGLGLQPVGVYKKMGSRNRKKCVKEIKVFHLDDIPQSALCQCGEMTLEKGRLEERLCLTCLEVRKQVAHEQGKLRLESQFEKFLNDPNALILMAYGNESKHSKMMTLIDVALVNLAGEVVYQTLVYSKQPLSEKVLEMGYEESMFEKAPDFLSINEELQAHLVGKNLLSHVMTKREGVLIHTCRQNGVWLNQSYETLCLFQLIYYCFHDLYPSPAKLGIEGICDYFDIPYVFPRSASRDALAILEIVKKLAQKMDRGRR